MASILGIGGYMSREHELNYAAFQLGRVLQYLYKSELTTARVDATDLIILAQAAVNAEYMLLESVRIFNAIH